MQAALRIEINQLESGLTIIDGGAERSVDSGFIDITARNTSGTTVIVELKAGPAGQRAVAQILSYKGDAAAEEESGKVRGSLVASRFDAKAKTTGMWALRGTLFRWPATDDDVECRGPGGVTPATVTRDRKCSMMREEPPA